MVRTGLDVSSVSSEAQGDQQQQQAKFFHKISVLALASYCNSRNLLPKECIRFKEVYGRKVAVFDKNRTGSAEILGSCEELVEKFVDKKIHRLYFHVLKDSDVVETLVLAYDYDTLSSNESCSTPVFVKDYKQRCLEELSALREACDELPKFGQEDYPLKLRLLTEIDGPENYMSSFKQADDDRNPQLQKTFYHNMHAASFEKEGFKCDVGLASKKLRA
ncbi:hypothetical protein FO519_002748 [Halicephalobus sp. NKZ332]|nr:hypothetical protein FO519_002748 [Halicephalobus sp. NKZ332]